MGKRRGLTAVLATLVSLSLFAAPVMANPGNGNGNGHGGGGQGNSSGNHGNKGNQGNNGQKGNSAQKNNGSSDHRKNYGKPDHVESDISFATARHLAVNYGLTGYDSLPPGIAKNLARGKPLPPGIAKKTVPASMLGQLPYYPGYEWKIVGDDLVLIALSTAVVTAIINSVFD